MKASSKRATYNKLARTIPGFHQRQQTTVSESLIITQVHELSSLVTSTKQYHKTYYR
jgi:hypothetical protein